MIFACPEVASKTTRRRLTMDKKTLIHVLNMIKLVECATFGMYGGKGFDLLLVILDYIEGYEIDRSELDITVLNAFDILADDLKKVRCIEE